MAWLWNDSSWENAQEDIRISETFKKDEIERCEKSNGFRSEIEKLENAGFELEKVELNMNATFIKRRQKFEEKKKEDDGTFFFGIFRV